MLVSVITIFLVLSFTGVAVLDISYSSRTISLETSKNIKAQFAFESTLNEALWKLNNGADSLVTDSSSTVITRWDAVTQTLTVAVDTMGYQIATEITMDALNPFEQHISTPNDLQTNGHAYGQENGTKNHKFKTMPEIDATYFFNNAVAIHHGNQNSWQESDLAKEGIHVFIGNNLEIDSRTFTNSTLYFMGNDITIINTTISAPTPLDSIDALPALVVDNLSTDFTVYASNVITGSIYTTGQINLESATMTGPVIGNVISLDEDIEFIKIQEEAQFTWNSGFGEEDSYDWDKSIDRWNTTKWQKKRSG
ncbi:MAG: hypothetical protein K9M49_04535 [Candidatus Marinimicrobia bacterium]|nr:hypothetical protein [Candidatus Neomarinimicrobiota bacterium]MCF7904404.1 hypothetical protein [Candidatus Neomarinimicrobiota bacterium]